jgi:D-alanyl-D-alanine carboxypeptidase
MQSQLPPLPKGYESRLRRFDEAASLVSVGPDYHGREAFLEPSTAVAWAAMKEAAQRDGIELLLISAFRSREYQEGIIRRKLDRGLPLDEILRVSAYPGFSEHHTGRAIDIGSPDSHDLTEFFEQTLEFSWLESNAARFGFSLSYPRDNPAGIAYEPWHWAHHSAA